MADRSFLERASWIAGIVSAVVAIWALNQRAPQLPSPPIAASSAVLPQQPEMAEVHFCRPDIVLGMMQGFEISCDGRSLGMLAKGQSIVRVFAAGPHSCKVIDYMFGLKDGESSLTQFEFSKRNTYYIRLQIPHFGSPTLEVRTSEALCAATD
jgi:hypothetical protein